MKVARGPGAPRSSSLPWLLALPALAIAAAIAVPRLVGPESGDTGTRPEDARPNILIFITDDQRADATLTGRTMPNVLRWFGEAGTTFPNAFAATPLCCPSRASMMTGQYAHNHGVTGNQWPQVRLLDHDTTIQRYLRDAGYRTAIFGKFFNHWPLRRNPPHFDRWATFFRGYEDVPVNVQGDVVRADYTTTFVGSQAVDFVRDSEADDERPWLMYVSVFAPHGRATPEARYESADVGRWPGNPAVFEEDRTDKPPYVQAETLASYEVALGKATAQRRTLLSVDDIVANIERVLEETGESRDTLAIFVGDNGQLWGEHGILQKRVPYLEATNIPLILRWPEGGVAAGAVDERLVATADIAPTVLDAAGVVPDHEVDARSLVDGTWERSELILENWAAADVPSWASVLTRSRQYVEYYEESSPRGAPTFREYYDLGEDPWQLENLLVTGTMLDATEIARLSGLVADLRACHGTRGRAACP